MKTFVVSDVHGEFAKLWTLLNREGLVDEDEQRTELGEATRIIQIGDLFNCVLEDVVGDEMCMAVARTWFDRLICGNHEWPHLFLDEASCFGGYYGHPPLRVQYNAWKRERFVIPCMLVGTTLITHAGFAQKGPYTASEAYHVIHKAWIDYPNWNPHIIDAMGYARGGRAEIGGVLWSDWYFERKNKYFSQVVGHNAIDKGPQLWERKDGTLTLNIDTGAQNPTNGPSAVWLNPDGSIDNIVSFR